MNTRPATEEEIEAALKIEEAFGKDNVRKNHDECLAEGLKDIVCDCGKIFLSQHHLVICGKKDCPVKGGKSLLDMMEET